MTSTKKIFFYIGTEAELLKLLPVIRDLEKRNYPFKIIFSGQNKIGDSYLLELLHKKEPDILITKKELKQSIWSLFTWFFWALYRTIFVFRLVVRDIAGTKIVVVQGDTLSTVIGAVSGKICGYKIAHIEAGYRSHHWFEPFPEEIDRVIVSYFADYHFYPNKELLANIKNRTGIKVFTNFNTNIDCLDMTLNNSGRKTNIQVKNGKKYFIFIMHRQENIMNKSLVRDVLREIDNISEDIECIFIKHSYTDSAVKKYHSRGKVKIMNKLPYFDFITLLQGAEYIITDGGGNQQEAFFLGKPCLILRKVTEGKEGIGENAKISGLDVKQIPWFAKNYQNYRRSRIVPKISPSKIIIDTIIK